MATAPDRRARDDLPEVVCLCGSTRFKDEYRAENARLTLEGKIVLSVGFFHHADEIPEGAEGAMDESGEWKREVDHLHLRKIDLADRVHVIDVDGYTGESTEREIEHARETGTPVTFYSGRPSLPDVDHYEWTGQMYCEAEGEVMGDFDDFGTGDECPCCGDTLEPVPRGGA